MRRKRSWLHGGSNPSRPTNKENMKYGIMILSILILNSCEINIGKKKDKNDNTVSKPIEIKELGNSDSIPYYRHYQIYMLDGCEYIEVNGGTPSTWGTHKGNCKNSIHKTDK